MGVTPSTSYLLSEVCGKAFCGTPFKSPCGTNGKSLPELVESWDLPNPLSSLTLGK